MAKIGDGAWKNFNKKLIPKKKDRRRSNCLVENSELGCRIYFVNRGCFKQQFN